MFMISKLPVPPIMPQKPGGINYYPVDKGFDHEKIHTAMVLPRKDSDSVTSVAEKAIAEAVNAVKEAGDSI